MPVRNLSIRALLWITISILTLLIALLVGGEVYVQWQQLQKIESLTEASQASDRLFDATEKLSIERDVAFALLHAPDDQDTKDLRFRLEDSRRDTDAGFDAAIAAFQQYNFPEFASLPTDIETGLANIRHLRQSIDEAIALPRHQRDNTLAQRWYDEVTTITSQTQDLWTQFIKHFTSINPIVTQHLRYRHFLRIISDYTGRERSLIGRLLVENANPTPEEIGQLLRWEGTIDLSWKMDKLLADESGLYDEIGPYFKDAQSHYMTMYDMVRDIFYVPGASHGKSYPISVDVWFELSTDSADSLHALKDASKRATHSYMDKLEREGKHSIIIHLATLSLALILCFYCFWTIGRRVIRPINGIIEALLDATQGKPVSLPPTPNAQDEIGKLARVLQAFQHNTEEVKRASQEAEKTREQLRQSQKMEALGQLTGGIAHDFNNLLAVIIGNLDFMNERTKTDDPLKEFILPSIEAAEHGAELTKQLLAFGRKQALQPKIISINELLPAFSALVHRTLGERIEIFLSPSPGLWDVSVDPSQLQSALLNLSVNARDAMPNGGRLVFETRNMSFDQDYADTNLGVEPGDYVMIAVSDTGEGMTEEVISKAFDPFFTTKAVGKGSGLGLSMVYGFVKQSAGHIKIYSEVGHGTSMKIYLPRAKGGASRDERKPEEIRIPPANKTKLILVVEDNKDVLKLTSAMVESLGYNVITAVNGEAALRIIESRNDIDLLLSDVMLPGDINGPALAKQALDRHPKLKVLFNSGYAEQAILQNGMLELGAHLITKPFRKQQLAAKLAELLSV